MKSHARSYYPWSGVWLYVAHTPLCLYIVRPKGDLSVNFKQLPWSQSTYLARIHAHLAYMYNAHLPMQLLRAILSSDSSLTPVQLTSCRQNSVVL